jgi:AcrR family transcriptional regulator
MRPSLCRKRSYPGAMASADEPDGRVPTAKGRATRERIVQAAAELILSDGLSAFTLGKVRAAASVSGSQLSHYFPDKQALIRAVVARQADMVLDFHREPALRGLATVSDWERWIDLNIRHVRRIGYAGTPTYRALAGRLVKSDEHTRRAVGAGYRQWVELVEASLRRMKDAGALTDAADPRQLALLIVVAHQGGGLLTFAYRDEWPDAHALRFAVNYLRQFAADDAEREPLPARRVRPRAVRPTDDRTGLALTDKGREVRSRIVDTAATLMFERGVGTTSLQSLRDSAGVSGSQLAHYFQDKNDLTRHVIAARRAHVVAFHTQDRLGRLDNLDALRAWADACVANIEPIYLRGGCFYGSLTGELLEADTSILDDIAGGYDEWLELFRAGLQSMCDRGALRPEADPGHLAAALLAAHQGGTLLTHATHSADPMRIAVRAAVEYVRSFASSH